MRIINIIFYDVMRYLRNNIYKILMISAISSVSICLIFSLFYINEKHTPLIEYKEEACRIPVLELNDGEIMKFMSHPPPLDCGSEEDWVKVDGYIATVTDEAKQKHGDIHCRFSDIVRSTDYSNFLGKSTISSTEYNFEDSDFVKVFCKAADGKTWESRLAGIRYDEQISFNADWKHLSKNALKLNVLMFGFDSLSRMTFMRKLKKSYQTLKSLNAIVLEGYNIVGDGTPQALIPILTGKSELELPEARKKRKDSDYVNTFPFVWNDFKKQGYVTAFMEDTPETGIFTYRLRGFNNEPTDHYMRSFYVDAEDDFKKFKKFCVGSTPSHKVMLNYARHIYTVYPNKPKFIFGFHGELSHDSHNLIEVADNDLTEWINWYKDKGYLNNTLLMIMSDHGQRFTDVRNTQQGKLEERLPFFSFVLPEWFSKLYPQAYENLKGNIRKLTSPFDINETLRSVFNYTLDTSKESLRKRGVSLFKEIPNERSCGMANIDPHWCSCLTWKKINVKDKIVEKVAIEFVKFINQYNWNYTNLCCELELKSLEEATIMIPNKDVLTFRQSKDNDGRIPEFSSATKLTKTMYQITLYTKPGDALFQFSATYHLYSQTVTFDIDEVSRINKYGDAPKCIYDEHQHLRKYCYCKDDIHNY